MDHDLSRRQRLSQLSPPGAPLYLICQGSAETPPPQAFPGSSGISPSYFPSALVIPHTHVASSFIDMLPTGVCVCLLFLPPYSQLLAVAAWHTAGTQ